MLANEPRMPDPTAASRAARADNGQFFNSLLAALSIRERDSDHGYPEQYGGQTDDEELRSRRHAQFPIPIFSLENGIKAKPR